MVNDINAKRKYKQEKLQVELSEKERVIKGLI